MNKSKFVKINHVCGHEEKHTIYYRNMEDQDNKIAYYQAEECSDCRQQKEIDKKLATGDYEVEEISYSRYKTEELWADRVPNSYNPSTKTIKVIVKKPEYLELDIVIADYILKIVSDAMKTNNELSRDQVKAMLKRFFNDCDKYNHDKMEAQKELKIKIEEIGGKVTKEGIKLFANKKGA